jgi:hypothetical protein
MVGEDDGPTQCIPPVVTPVLSVMIQPAMLGELPVQEMPPTDAGSPPPGMFVAEFPLIIQPLIVAEVSEQ